jgi:tripartite-type tricarboxylate transporter receptor subunit TctC
MFKNIFRDKTMTTHPTPKTYSLRRRTALIASAATPTLLLPNIASAQTANPTTNWPNRPVKIVFPVGPGGANDAIVRLMGAKLQEIWKQPVVVDFKPGAGIIIGTDFVAKSAPDGYTLGVMFGALMSTHILYGNKLPYDTLRDVTGVTEIGNTPFGLYAHPSFAPNTIGEIIAYAKANPGKLNYTATPTNGASHLSGELFNIMSGIKMVHVPYRGAAPSQIDVLAGRVPLWFSSIGEELKGMVANKQLKPIATTGLARSPNFPNTPTINETLPGYNVVGILGIIAPSGIPPELRSKISADMATALLSSDVKERMIQLGMTPVASNPEQINAKIASEITRWSRVIKEAGLTAE